MTQTTLDKFLNTHSMPRKPNKAGKGRGQSAWSLGNDRDPIETVTPPPKVMDKNHRSGEHGENPPGREKDVDNKKQVGSSYPRRSPRLHAQRSKLIPKPTLTLIPSPPLPVHQPKPVFPRPPSPCPVVSSSLPIDTRPSQNQRDPSASAPISSYHTAKSSPPQSTNTPSSPRRSIMSHVKSSSENGSIKEIPSSLPWENSPSDSYGDVWPSSQSASSPTKSQVKPTSQRSQFKYDDGFRVPDLPTSRTAANDTQNRSQLRRRAPSLQSLHSKSISQHDSPHSYNLSLEDTQDESQPNTAESKDFLDETRDLAQSDPPPEPTSAVRKRKRELTILEMPDSLPPGQLVSPSKPASVAISQDDSCVILSQPPPSMRKKTPEIITIHSSQSQSPAQDCNLPSGLQQASRDLSNSSGRTSSDTSLPSMHQHSHQWESSQITQSPVLSLNMLNSPVDPPSQLQLSSQNDLSRIPEPLAMTLDFLPRKAYEDMPDLSQLEKQQGLNLQKWEKDTRKPRSQ